MTINELCVLHTNLEYIITRHEDKMADDGILFESYCVDEYGVWELYRKIINGKATRKDVLIFGINDMLDYINKNSIEIKDKTYLNKFIKEYL